MARIKNINEENANNKEISCSNKNRSENRNGKKEIPIKRFLTTEAAAEGEWVAGVTRKELLDAVPDLPVSGVVRMDEVRLREILKELVVFRPRTEELERDESFKQLITYFVITNSKGQFLFSRRKAKGGEARAHGAYLFGFGGHVRKSDMVGELKDWLGREFAEEVVADRVEKITFLGLLNNDSDEMQKVNRVHFGLVFKVDVGDGTVQLREKDKFVSGRFVSLTHIGKQRKGLETWSRISWDCLAGFKRV